MTGKFEVGKTYQVRSLCDWDCIFSFVVVGRTAKFVTLDCGHGEVKRVGVRIWNGAETARPFGTYSMCATISADRELVSA